MILQRLCSYYDRLAADPNQTMSEEGFAPQKVSFEVVIEPNGTLHAIQDIRDHDDKKPAPKLMRLPECGKRTSGVSAQFLWDKADYLLGWVSPELANSPEDESEADQKKRLKKLNGSPRATPLASSSIKHEQRSTSHNTNCFVSSLKSGIRII